MKIFAHTLPPLAVVVACLAASVTSLPAQESQADSTAPAQGSRAPTAEEAIKTKCLVDGQLAVTFDDGPSPPNTPNLLKLLDENEVPATFFVNANNVGNIMDPSSPDADIVRKAYEAGHVIASHTYGHPDLTGLSDQAVREQLCWVDRAIARIIGKAPKLFRAPFGAVNDNLLQTLDSLGYTIVHWNIDTSDWKVENTIENMVKEYTDTLRTAKSGVALQHDIHARTVNDLMPAVFAAIKAFGDEGNKLTYVTADVCVGSEPYRDDPWQDTDPYADWYCPTPTQ